MIYHYEFWYNLYSWCSRQMWCFLHVEVVVAGKVCVQNEFFDFVVLRIEQNVLKLPLIKISSFTKKSISIVFNVIYMGWCYHPHGEVVVEVVWAKCCRSSVRVWGMDLHLVLRFVENLNKCLNQVISQIINTFEGAPIPAITSCTESPNLSRADWLVLVLRDKSPCFIQSSLFRRHEL